VSKILDYLSSKAARHARYFVAMNDMNIVPADTIPAAALHAAFAAAFSDYLLGPFNLPLAQWPVFTGRQGADLAQSRAALRDGRLLAFALVAPRPEIGHWRLATMGALPEARGSGAAPALLDDFIGRAAAAGMRGVELECFAQNERALRLYRSRGFEAIHPLYGYTRAAGAPTPGYPADATVRSVDLPTAFDWLDRCNLELGDLPLQVTPVSLRAQPVALLAWQRGAAQLVFAVNGDESVAVHSLVDRRAEQQDAQALAARLVQAYPKHRFVVPQLQRPDLGGEALERLGFARQPLHQLLMRRGA
jgi:ribosomal protein S18 acetylase RimI-like enzyme